jgi:hypothetical protein
MEESMNRIIRTIHRIAGIIGSVIVFVMAITGILLNHRSWIGYSSETSVKFQKFLFGLHSGAIGSMSFIWITDLGAICMIVLSLTGFFMWFRGKRIMKIVVVKRLKRRNEI